MKLLQTSQFMVGARTTFNEDIMHSDAFSTERVREYDCPSRIVWGILGEETLKNRAGQSDQWARC
jgi:hypothetical protein